MYSDFTQVHAQTGAHVEVLEIDDLVERVESADAAAIGARATRSAQTFDLADAGADPIAAEITPEIFDWSARVAVGLDRLVDGLRTGRAHLLLPRRRREHRRARRGRADRRQLAADGARRAGGRGGRPEDVPRDAPARPPRRRRLLHRVLRARLRRGVHPDGPRRPGPPGDRRRPAGRAGAQALPRQVRRRALDRDAGPARAGDDPRPDPDGRRPAEADRRRGRVDRRADVQDRQHELADPLRVGPDRVLRPLVRRRPDAPRRARGRAPARRACARSPTCSGSSSPPFGSAARSS